MCAVWLDLCCFMLHLLNLDGLVMSRLGFGRLVDFFVVLLL